MSGISVLTAQEIIDILGLEPMPREGGYYVETCRSDEMLGTEVLPARYTGPRRLHTAIYYLLTPDTFSTMHRVVSDEVFHFYLGDPVEMLHLFPDGSHAVLILGSDMVSGQRPQVLVPSGVWQGCRLIDGGEFALMGTTVAPGFEFADYEQGDPDQLTHQYPKCKPLIAALTSPWR